MRDILLQISSYPEPTTSGAIDQAVRLAARVGGRLSALALQAGLKTPDSVIVNFLIGLSDFADDEERKSLEICRRSLAHFTDAAETAGVLGSATHAQVDVLADAAFLARQGFYRDMLMIPVEQGSQIKLAEAAIFSSGRPVLVLRSSAPSVAPLGTVMVAWDASAPAVRALSDAVPLLQQADAVKVVAVVDDKPEVDQGSAAHVLRRLEAHGVAADLVEIHKGRATVGAALEACATDMKADLVVMGAFGRPRALQFLLGGATHHFLHQTRLPVMFAH